MKQILRGERPKPAICPDCGSPFVYRLEEWPNGSAVWVGWCKAGRDPGSQLCNNHLGECLQVHQIYATEEDAS